ncbi:MAG: extracellular solute-binding protein [Hyphomonadaceae bacterium]|jgi:microcin C transport system substrate-binding protein|nr:extracellular solute-binding protein [Hyphomonadaceae bacterium]
MTPCLFRFWMPALLAVVLGAVSAQAADRHGLSAFNELKYPADFKHFDWVNPDAPKGGRLALIGPVARTTFDSFNGFILKGDAAQGLELLFDALMTRAYDEPDAVYGLVAQSADLAPDRSSVTFRMRPEARFADGTPLTSADVVFSFDILKAKGHPNIRAQLRDVAGAAALDAHTVRFDFTGSLARDLPLVVAGLPILSKTYYATREFDQTTLDPPLGSGPFRIGDHNQGVFVSYRRREDYWGKDLPVNRGRFNFDEVRYQYFRDRAAELLALQAGEFDLREEFTALAWVTGYDVPAVKSGKLLRTTLPDASPSGAQGFFLNTRRARFADVRVRKALDTAFDFEFANKTIFYELYTRTESFFENSPMKASGKPSAEELALLEPFRDSLAPEVFGEPYRPPVSDGSGKDRKLLQAADKLLNEAGWTVKNGARVNAKGEVFNLEFLIVDPTSERISSNYVENLKRLGLAISIRRVDPAQYQRRVKSFDFDVVTARYSLRLTPGVELASFWGSETANVDGSLNLAGIANPAIDALIGKVVGAKSRAELEVATRALDRVLRAGHYWVPQWYKAAHHIAHWDRFSWPVTKPRYERGIVDTWWYDAAKAQKLKAN